MELNSEQIEFLDKFAKGEWAHNKKTGLVDIIHRFDCSCKNLSDFKGVRFGEVKGDFDCSHNNLTSLVGAPQKVGGDFYCHNNKLTSLEGAPQKVGGSFFGGHFYCYRNNLTSLVGAPQVVKRNFNCSGNKLTSLEGAPQKVGGNFRCERNKLTSLEGAPQKVGGNFYCESISDETLKLVLRTMQEKKIDYWTALCILKSEIPKSDLENLEGELEKRLSQDAQKGYSTLDQFGFF